MSGHSIVGYRLWWQSFDGRRIGMGDPAPARCFMDFASKEEAESYRRFKLATGPETVATITPVPLTTKAKAVRRSSGRVPLL